MPLLSKLLDTFLVRGALWHRHPRGSWDVDVRHAQRHAVFRGQPFLCHDDDWHTGPQGEPHLAQRAPVRVLGIGQEADEQVALGTSLKLGNADLLLSLCNSVRPTQMH